MCSATSYEDALVVSSKFSGGGAVRIILASASSSIRAIWPNMERCHDWIIAVRLGCLVILLTSLLRTDWNHLVPSSVLRYSHTKVFVYQPHFLKLLQVGLGHPIREPLGMSGGFYRPDALRVIQPTVSKHWRKVKALMPTTDILSYWLRFYIPLNTK